MREESMKIEDKIEETMSITLEVPLGLYNELEALFPHYQRKCDQHFSKRLLLEILLTKTLFKALKSQRESRHQSISREPIGQYKSITERSV
jgi:hypothetical protein